MRQQQEPPRDSGSGTDPSGQLSQEPQSRVVATYRTYNDAERAVEFLADQDFPVERVSIIGRDVQIVEQIVGRLNYGGAALRGAGAGSLTGLLTGWLFGLFNWVQPLITGVTLAAYGLVFGAVVGALTGLLMRAMQGGRRDFAAIRGWQPTRYDIEVDEEVADEAERLLAKSGQYMREITEQER